MLRADHRRPRTFLLSLTAAVLAIPACAGETETLFEEHGVWELSAYTLEMQSQSVGSAIDQSFFLKFDAGENVLQTAMCAQDDGQSPISSPCRQVPEDSAWFCQCFAYAFEGDRMGWKPFDAGGTIPPVGIPASDENADGDPSSSPTAGADLVEVAEVDGQSATYQFFGLPRGIFGSEGASSAYTFVQKAPSLFDQVYDDPDMRPSCEPCFPGF